jgi:hypothetical protein
VGMDVCRFHLRRSDDHCDCIPFVCAVFVDVSVCMKCSFTCFLYGCETWSVTEGGTKTEGVRE